MPHSQLNYIDNLVPLVPFSLGNQSECAYHHHHRRRRHLRRVVFLLLFPANSQATLCISPYGSIYTLYIYKNNPLGQETLIARGAEVIFYYANFLAERKSKDEIVGKGELNSTSQRAGDETKLIYVYSKMYTKNQEIRP